MSRRVEYSELGGPEVLRLIEVEPPHPAAGEVRVQVRAAGLNPLDAKLFRGMPTSAGATVALPSGNGQDFAGAIDELGDGVTEFALGDEVFGSRQFHGQADFVIASPSSLVLKPAAVTFEVAAGLATVGRTAMASVESLNLSSDDTVFISAAAGGVGALAAQLAIRTGARVVGSASRSNHAYLESLGVTPVQYGDGLVAALRDAAPGGYTAALDNHGRDSVDAAVEVGVPASRINTIADYGAPARIGAANVGGTKAAPDALARLVHLIADGDVTLPIDSVFPLERVSEAYERLLAGHVRGKIVLALQ